RALAAGTRRARRGRRGRRLDDVARHRALARRRPRRVARPHEVHAARRDRRRDRRLGRAGRAGRRRGGRGRARDVARPVAARHRRRDALRAAGGRAPRAGAPVAPRARAARPAGRRRRRARGRRVAPRGHVGERGRARGGVAPAARDRGRPPLDPARDRLAAHGGPPAQGLLPRAGDHRARAQPRPPAAPGRHAAPRRLRAPAAGGRRRGDARRPRRGDRDVGRAPPRARADRARRAQAERARGRGAARRLRRRCDLRRPGGRRARGGRLGGPSRAAGPRRPGHHPARRGRADEHAVTSGSAHGPAVGPGAVDVARTAWRRLLLRARVRQGGSRVRAALVPVLLAAAAAGIAYGIARYGLGHAAPFFAPVAAWICLGFSPDRQLRRVAEVAVGVAIGVGLGDVVVRAIGSGWWQIAVVVAVSALAARFIDRGAMLTTQAGVQAIVIVALPVAQSGGPLGRWTDALVGGAVAFAVAALTPGDPRRRPRLL